MKLKNWSTCTALLLGLTGGLLLTGTQPAQAQEGRAKGGIRTIRVVQGEELPQTPLPPPQIQVEGKKLIIVDQDGKQKEIQLPQGGSITVTQSAEETNRDGKVDRKVVGKAVIIGPDGQKQEIELDGGGFAFGRAGEPMQFQAFPPGMAISKFFIGVHCEPVDDETRAELRLAENAGLQVLEVTADSPAEAAGLKSGDILLYANDTELATREQLIEAVQKAGDSESELGLALIRDGKEEKIVVRPAQRPDMPPIPALPGIVGGLEIMGGPEGLNADLDVDLDALRKQMEQMKVQIFQNGPEGAVQGFAIPMPGIIREGFAAEFDPQQMEELKAQLTEARQQLEQARAELEKSQARIQEELQRAQKEIRLQMEEARQQMEKAVEELRKSREKGGEL